MSQLPSGSVTLLFTDIEGPHAEDPLARTGEVLSVRQLAAELGVDDDASLSR